MNFIINGPDGKPQFVGKEDPHNPSNVVAKPHEHGSECGHMQCAHCQGYFDYLVGDDIGGGRRGCETCWRPAKQNVQRQPEQSVEEIIS